ncbi:MAG: cation:dicarboxylase symporter family transporter [Treponema sp.]|nr:cation:dicarboxylase symporter family transporter [Treponema sp.]
MKVWLKLLIGSILGMLLGFLVPSDHRIYEVIDMTWLVEFVIRIGRYCLIPVLVFSFTISVYELRQDNRFWGLLLKTFLVLIFSSVFVIAAGIATTLFFPPSRIPILIEEQAEAISLSTLDNVLNIFPSNMFASITGDGIFLLPVCIFAFFLGMGLSYDKHYTKPIVAIIDSLSRIFFYIVTFFSEIMALLLIVLSAYWAIQFHHVLRTDMFRDLILLLGVFSIVMGFIILPLFLYFIRPKTNPWALLYGSISQALAGFFSGCINFTLPMVLLHVKENLGVRRRSNTITVSIFAIFGRAGSAMVAAVAFIVIINSYSSLGIPMSDIMIIALRALIISFLLAGFPGNGAYIALAVLCLDFSRGFEAGYLILKPLAFYLIAVGTFLDIMINTVATYAIGKTGGLQEDRKLRQFI